MFHHFRVLSLYCGFVSCVLISRRAHVLVFSAFTFPDSLLENTEASVFFSLAYVCINQLAIVMETWIVFSEIGTLFLSIIDHALSG